MAGKHSLNSKDYFETNSGGNIDNTDTKNEEEQQNNNDFQNNIIEEQFNYAKFKDNDFDEDYYDDEDRSRRKAIICICIIIVALILAIAGFVAYRMFESKKEDTNTPEEVVEDKMIATYEGYDVLGKIKIDKLGVEQYILDSTEDKALEKGVGKLYGGTLNNYGNFCIAGHNYKEIFENIGTLEVGDKFTIIDPKLEETTYKVSEISSAEPDDLKALIQNDEKVEITLITCDKLSTARIIVKAEEVVEDTEETTETNTVNTVNTNSVIDSEENV